MNFQKPAKNNICAVFVTANCDLNFPERVSSIIDQVDCVVVVDNGSNKKVINMLENLCTNEKISIIFNKENLGIAAALNKGIHLAKDKGYCWVLTLDHDSICEVNIIDKNIEILNSIGEKEKIAILGCNHFDTNSQHYLVNPQKNNDIKWTEKKVVITSGSLMPIKAFDIIGPFREDFFIDGVDLEYCLRARKNGFKVIFILEPLIKHSIGKKEVITLRPFHFIKITKTNYAIFRRYYWVRNNLILIQDYLFVEPLWALIRLTSLIGSIVKALTLEDERIKKFKMIKLGFIDFLTKKMDRRVLP